MRLMHVAPAVLAVSLAVSGGLHAQDFALKAGESTDLFGVYWVVNCKSILRSFAGADVMSGPPELQASLREAQVLPRRQGCPEEVPGAMLVLTAGDVRQPFEGTVRIRVRYDTPDGLKQSLHSVKVLLVPRQ